MQIGYARVSGSSQDHALQLDALNAAGCERIFIETASGLKADRPELQKLLDHVRPGDLINIYSLSRLARSIRHLLELAEDLRARNVGLKSLTEGFDTSSPAGRFMFNVLGSLSQMEVELLRERTHAGLRAARARGRVGGRPKVLDAVKLRVVKTLIAEGTMTMAEIADHVQVAPSTIYRSVRGGRSALF
ncbi:Serine recombinase PinE [Hyphomicrobiales bacterium]|nr:recombinase family protein [Bosea sp. (in: a-proteobacteria)]CAH1696449.1 Serine recombinase PinE [Hyphomicrobiales bacterium]CAH1696468.1 Serine recombinase PinE [Hyphomicrobiales bacterium]